MEKLYYKISSYLWTAQKYQKFLIKPLFPIPNYVVLETFSDPLLHEVIFAGSTVRSEIIIGQSGSKECQFYSLPLGQAVVKHVLAHKSF